MRLKLADGGHLHYEVHGHRGDWLVLLNGAMATTASWGELTGLLASRHRVLLLDFRDQGQSSPLPPGYRVTRHAGDVIALLDEVGAERVDLFGTSYGGLAALAVVDGYPERVRRLLLASTAAPPSARLRAVGVAWERVAAAGDGETLLAVVAASAYSQEFHRRGAELLELRRRQIAPRLTPAWFESFIRISRSARELDWTPALASIRAPTLLLCGGDDELVAPGEVFAMADSIPDSTCLAIPGVGHALFIERPRAVAAAILGFTALEA